MSQQSEKVLKLNAELEALLAVFEGARREWYASLSEGDRVKQGGTRGTISVVSAAGVEMTNGVKVGRGEFLKLYADYPSFRFLPWTEADELSAQMQVRREQALFKIRSAELTLESIDQLERLAALADNGGGNSGQHGNGTAG